MENKKRHATFYGGETIITEGRPKRDTKISKDEIINLKIDLEILTVDEFLRRV